jgi:hypothetical protein
MTERIRGVLAPVVTPFKADLSPDGRRFIAHCKWLLSQNCGLAVFGTNSEANSLAYEERAMLLDELVAAGVDPARTMPGTGSCSLMETVKLTGEQLWVANGTCRGTRDSISPLPSERTLSPLPNDVTIKTLRRRCHIGHSRLYPWGEIPFQFLLDSTGAALRRRCGTGWKELEGCRRLRTRVITEHRHKEIFDTQSIRASLKS